MNKNAMTTVSILHIINEACKHPYKNNLTALIYSLVNGLYKVTTKSIKFVCDVEQFGASSDFSVPTPDVQKVPFSSSTTHPC